MGTFLSMTSIVGKTKDEVVNSLTKYAKSVGGGLQKAALSVDRNNCCVIEEAVGNTSVLYPLAYLEWDSSSEFISGDLKAPVFSFHIHDGDLWMYLFFVNGKVVDQFNPVPDYWDEDLSEEEIQSWKGNATAIAKYIPSVRAADIKKYLARWDLDAKESVQAYPDDEFAQEDWQLLDFMKKLGLPYPLNDDGTARGETYKLWTKDLSLQAQKAKQQSGSSNTNSNKPWWKFW